MNRPITAGWLKETPILRTRFLKKMHEAEIKPITKKEKAEYIRGKKLYDSIKARQVENIINRIAERYFAIMRVRLDPKLVKLIAEELGKLQL